MRWPWKREPDPVAREVAEQSARVAEQSAQSKAALERVDHVLRTADSIIDDYSLADQERLRGGNRDPR